MNQHTSFSEVSFSARRRYWFGGRVIRAESPPGSAPGTDPDTTHGGHDGVVEPDTTHGGHDSVAEPKTTHGGHDG